MAMFQKLVRFLCNTWYIDTYQTHGRYMFLVLASNWIINCWKSLVQLELYIFWCRANNNSITQVVYDIGTGSMWYKSLYSHTTTCMNLIVKPGRYWIDTDTNHEARLPHSVWRCYHYRFYPDFPVFQEETREINRGDYPLICVTLCQSSQQDLAENPLNLKICNRCLYAAAFFLAWRGCKLSASWLGGLLNGTWYCKILWIFLIIFE